MKIDLRHPAVILAALATVSATLGSYFQGVGYGDAPYLGLHMVLTGAWFGLVVGFGVWRWVNRSWSAAALAFAATWVGWQLAVNLALQLEERWLKAISVPAELTIFVTGVAAGAVGAISTWAGAAAFAHALRQTWIAASFAVVGAALGLLLPFTNHYDNALVLLLPWQTTIAALLGFGLGSRLMRDPDAAGLRTDDASGSK